MATRLARLSGTTPHFWLDRQQQHDLWQAERVLQGVLELIPAHTLPAALRKEIGLRYDL